MLFCDIFEVSPTHTELVLSRYDDKADVFSAGVVMWEVLMGTNKNRNRLRGDCEKEQFWVFMITLGPKLRYFFGSEGTFTSPDDLIIKLNARYQGKQPSEWLGLLERWQNESDALEGPINLYSYLNGVERDSMCFDLFTRMLKPSPKHRISFSDALAHHYFDEVRHEFPSHDVHPSAGVVAPGEGCQCSHEKLKSIVTDQFWFHHWRILTEWLRDVARSRTLSAVTLSLTYQILRRYYMSHRVERGELQTYGCAAMYVKLF